MKSLLTQVNILVLLTLFASFQVSATAFHKDESLFQLNEDIWKGKWKEIKGHMKGKWGKLTDDDLTTIEGQ